MIRCAAALAALLLFAQAGQAMTLNKEFTLAHGGGGEMVAITTDELSAAMDAAQPLGAWDLVSLLIGVNNQYRGRDVADYAQQFDGLRCQRHQVRAAIELAIDGAFHLGRRDGPDMAVEVHLVPLHGPHVAWTLKEQGGQQEGDACDRLSRIVVYGPHQFAGLCRFQDGGHVLDVQRLKCAVKVGRRIAFAAAGGNSIAEHLASSLTQGVRGFPGTTLLDFAERVEQHGGRDLRKGNRADPGEQVLLHAFEPAFSILLAPPAGLGGLQFPSHFFEGVCLRKLGFQFLDLPTFGWVRARLQGAAGYVTLAASLLQGNRRVGAKSKAFFFVSKAVFPEPTPGSTR